MGDFDLAPPPLPGEHVEKKPGLLKRFFAKKAEPVTAPPPAQQYAAAPLPSSPAPDLEEIKRKLGIMEESIPSPVAAPTPAPIIEETPAPTTTVHIDDWTQADENAKADVDNTSVTTTPVTSAATTEQSPWSAVSETPRTSAPSVTLPADDAHDQESQENIHEDTLNNAGTASQQLLPHHAIIDEHLADIDRAHEKIQKTLQQIANNPAQVPDWAMQEKEILPDQYFILRNGQPLRSLAELTEALTYIDDITFDHHVNEHRNDFANWIQDVVKNPTLASAVRASTTREHIRATLLDAKQKALKATIKEHQQLQKTVQKRKEAVQELLTTEKKLDLLHKQLEQRTKELIEQKKKYADLIKKKLDAQVQQKLSQERTALQKTGESQQKAQQELQTKQRALAQKELELAGKEKELLINSMHYKKEIVQLQEDRREIADLLKRADVVKKELTEIKKHKETTEKLAKEAQERDATCARREEAMVAKEKKLTADLTKLSQLQTEMKVQQEEFAKQKTEAILARTTAKKITDDAKARRDEALAIERSSRERINTDTKKLQALKTQIEKALANVKDEKTRVSRAVALRKQYDDAITTTKQDIVMEREQLEKEKFSSMIEEQSLVTPVGQVSMNDEKDVLQIKHPQLYEKVIACKRALETKDITTARALYNELRDIYSRTEMGPAERETLYNEIRELYDDIHLAMLG